MPLNISDLLAAEDSPERSSGVSGHSPSDPYLPSSEDEAGSDVLPQVTSQKRPREDYSTFCSSLARNVRLKKEDESTLTRFSKLTSPQQRITLMAHILGSHAEVRGITPAESVYHIPTSLNGRLERLAFAMLVSPDCIWYVHKDTVNDVVAELEKHPEWGFTADIKEDKAKFKVVTKRIRGLLTHRRNQLKTLMKDSLGNDKEVSDGSDTEKSAMDVVTLCERVLASGASVMKRDVKVSLQMMARFAFLRRVLHEVIESSGNQDEYWPKVDVLLKEVRKEKRTCDRMTRFFLNILEQDAKEYGAGDRSDLASNDTAQALFGNRDE